MINSQCLQKCEVPFPELMKRNFRHARSFDTPPIQKYLYYLPNIKLIKIFFFLQKIFVGNKLRNFWKILNQSFNETNSNFLEFFCDCEQLKSRPVRTKYISMRSKPGFNIIVYDVRIFPVAEFFVKRSGRPYI